MTLGNQSSSQLQMGPSQKRGPRALRRDEDPSWDCEDPLQLLEEAPGAHAMLFIIKIIVGIIIKQIPPESGRRLFRWSTSCHLIMMPTLILMIKSIAHAPGATSNSWRGSSQSQEGSSSLLSVRGPLFWLGPICSCEELWFLVVLDTAFSSCPATHMPLSSPV